MHEGEEGHKLQKLIKQAIADLELTTSEYEEIMAQAHSDGQIDPDEARLLHELQELISDGTVKRVPG
jgi:DnaJ-domain-containing protein 1